MSKSRIVKRVPLEDVIGMQDENCYMLVTPVNYQERAENYAQDFSKMSDEESVQYQESWVRDRFVGGKFLALNDKGEFDLTDLTIEDVLSSVDLCDAAYYATLGVDVDPKAIRAAEALLKAQPTDAKDTETSSSEDSPKAKTSTSTDTN